MEKIVSYLAHTTETITPLYLTVTESWHNHTIKKSVHAYSCKQTLGNTGFISVQLISCVYNISNNNLIIGSN